MSRHLRYRNIRSTMLIGAAALSLCCDRDDRPAVRSGYPIMLICPADAVHIPVDYLGAPRDSNTAIAERIHFYLKAAGENPLWCGGGGEAYRGIWIAANRPTRLGTVKHQANGWTAEGIVFQDPRRTNAANSIPVIDQQFRPEVSTPGLDKVIAAVADGDLWTAPAWRYSVETFDGETLVLEIRDRGAYRVITRDKVTDEPVNDAVRAVLEAAGVSLARD